MDNSGAVNIPVPDVSPDGLLHKTESVHRRCVHGDGRPEHLSEHDSGHSEKGGRGGVRIV